MDLQNQNQSELDMQLKKMKKALQRKEKRLSKFNKVLNSRKHVKETILRKKLENSGNFEDQIPSSKEPDDCNPRIHLVEKKSVSKFVKFDERGNGATSLDSCIDNNLQNLEEDVKKFNVSSIKGRLISKQGHITQLTDKLHSSNAIKNLDSNPCERKSPSIKKHVHNFDSEDFVMPKDLTECLGTHPDTPILSQAKCKGYSLQKRGCIKKLFSPYNNTGQSASSKHRMGPRLDNEIETCDTSPKIERRKILEKVVADFPLSPESPVNPSCAVPNQSNIQSNAGKEVHNKNRNHFGAENLPPEIKRFKEPSLNDPSQIYEERLKTKEDIITSNIFNTSKKNDSNSSASVEFQNLQENHLGNLISSAISSPLNALPTIFLAYSEGFSIWTLEEDETRSKPESCFMWTKDLEDENNLFESLQSNNFCLFGVKAELGVGFIVIHDSFDSPYLSMILIQISLSKEVKIIRKSTPFSGCRDCSFLGCSLHCWNFLLYIQPCANPLCPNAIPCGVLFSVSFDLLYSQKKSEWEVRFEATKKVALEESPLVSINLLCNYANVFERVPGDSFALWQDSFGHLGLAGVGSSLSISKLGSNLPLDEIINSGKILYAAVVKEILLLILETEENYEFLAVNPLTLQYDVFYQLRIREVNPGLGDVTSVVFAERNFSFVTSTASVLSVAIEHLG